MKFKYNRKTFSIESDDPAIFVRWMGSPREEGEQFLLSMDQKNYGFQTARDLANDQSEHLPDGTYVWRIDVVLCRIDRWDDLKMKRVNYADTFRFKDLAEQERVLRIFTQALAAYDRRADQSDAGNAKARVEYTERVQSQIANGDLIQ